MGKNRAIESLGSLIGNTIVHKILIEKTSRPESVNHLEFEEIEYRSQAIKKGELFNWSDDDTKLLKKEINKKIENKFANKYSDIEIPKEKLQKMIDEEISQVLKVNKK